MNIEVRKSSIRNIVKARHRDGRGQEKERIPITEHPRDEITSRLI